MECINLQTLFGERYRIDFDAAYDHRGVPRAKLDPWYMQISCRNKGVTIYPHSATHLAVEVNNHFAVAQRLEKLSGVTLWQDGFAERSEGERKVSERTFIFPLEIFDQVAAIVEPRRRRRLSPAQREAARQRLSRFAFRSAPQGEKPASERTQNTAAVSQDAQAEIEAFFAPQLRG